MLARGVSKFRNVGLELIENDLGSDATSDFTGPVPAHTVGHDEEPEVRHGFQPGQLAGERQQHIFVVGAHPAHMLGDANLQALRRQTDGGAP